MSDHHAAVEIRGESAVAPRAGHLTPVDEQTLSVAEGLGITEPWMLQQLQEIVRLALVGHVVFDNDGNELGTVANLPAATKAVELLMKQGGMFVERHEHQHSVRIELVGVNPDQLR